MSPWGCFPLDVIAFLDVRNLGCPDDESTSIHSPRPGETGPVRAGTATGAPNVLIPWWHERPIEPQSEIGWARDA